MAGKVTASTDFIQDTSATAPFDMAGDDADHQADAAARDQGQQRGRAYAPPDRPAQGRRGQPCPVRTVRGAPPSIQTAAWLSRRITGSSRQAEDAGDVAAAMMTIAEADRSGSRHARRPPHRQHAGQIERHSRSECRRDQRGRQICPSAPGRATPSGGASS